MIYAIDCIGVGIAVQGHEIPDIKMKITLVNTKRSIPNSRCEQKYDSVIPKKVAANRYGIRNAAMVNGSPICGNLNI